MPRDSTPRAQILDVHIHVQDWEKKEHQHGKGSCTRYWKASLNPSAAFSTIVHRLLWTVLFCRAVEGKETKLFKAVSIPISSCHRSLTDPSDLSSILPLSCPGLAPGLGCYAGLRGLRSIKPLWQYFWPCFFIFVLFLKVTNSLFKRRRKEECTRHARETFSSGFS